MNKETLYDSDTWYKKWQKETGLSIMFPNGWNYPRHTSWAEPITYEDFLEKVKESELGIEVEDEVSSDEWETFWEELIEEGENESH